MPTQYYPQSFIKKNLSPVQELQQAHVIQSVSGHVDLTSSGLTYNFAPTANCEILEVQLAFGSTASKNYAISKALGRGIVKGLNDTLWFQPTAVTAQQITIPAGFYNGTALATAIQSQLNSNEIFEDVGATPFSVTYTSVTGLFAITPNSGTVQYLNPNTTVPIFYQNSTLGPLIGFNTSQSYASSLSSTSPVFGLSTTVPILSNNASTDQYIVSTDELVLDIDQALQISVSAVATTLDYKIVYRLV